MARDALERADGDWVRCNGSPKGVFVISSAAGLDVKFKPRLSAFVGGFIMIATLEGVMTVCKGTVRSRAIY